MGADKFDQMSVEIIKLSEDKKKNSGRRAKAKLRKEKRKTTRRNKNTGRFNLGEKAQ